MTKEAIFDVIKQNVLYVLPDIAVEDIRIEESLRDLGANSIDRMEIVVKTLEKLALKVPLVEFGFVQNLQGLVDLLHEKKSACV